MKKRDGRTLDRRTMEPIRMDAVALVKAGEDISNVMASYRIARTTYCKWVARTEASDGTVHSQRCRKARGTPCHLTQQQKSQVRRCIAGKDPRQ